MSRLLYWRARTRTLQSCSLTRAGEPRLFHALGFLCKNLFSDRMCYDFQCDCNGNQTKEKLKSMHRVLCGIYRLGKRSPECPTVTSFLGTLEGTPPPPKFFKWKCARCNLVHFETQFWELLQWYFVYFSVVITFWQCYNTPCSLSYSVLWQGILHVHWPRRLWMIFPILFNTYIL